MTAELQARRRLGLTATLVREDGKEDDVFALIGPKKYDVPWKDLERQGWIATAHCHEIRLDMAPEQRIAYAMADSREQALLAATDPAKLPAVEQIIAKHPDDQVLVIGTYLDQLGEVASRLDVPLLTGKTPTRERQKLYQQMREGTLRRLVVSKVATSPSTCPTSAWPSRSAAPSARDRRRPSVWAASCAPSTMAVRPISTPSSCATPRTRPSPPSARCS